MKHLALEEGWAPLFMYAPRNHEAHARVKRHLMAKGDEFTFIPATDGDWETIRVAGLAQRSCSSGATALLVCTKIYGAYKPHTANQLHQECVLCLPETWLLQVTLPTNMRRADGQKICTVHADVRLMNIIARRRPRGWQIRFVDFAWSGIQGVSR